MSTRYRYIDSEGKISSPSSVFEYAVDNHWYITLYFLEASVDLPILKVSFSFPLARVN